LDLTHPLFADYLVLLRALADKEVLPVWALSFQQDKDQENLFFALGGNGILDAEKPFQDDLLPLERGGESLEYPILLDFSEESRLHRLMETLDLIRIRKNLAALSHKTCSLEETAGEILKLVDQVCQPHISLLIVNNQQNAEAYIRPGKMVFAEDYQDFRNFCLNDFFLYFKGLDLMNMKEKFYLEGRENFHKISMERQKISSYFFLPILDGKQQPVATLHVGHLSNNYFTGKLTQRIGLFAEQLSGSFCYALRMSQLRRRKEKILDIFGRFVPSDIIPELIEQEKSKRSFKAEKKTLAVLFSDIRSFTTITESNSAQKVVDFLNSHFEIMVEAIHDRGGIIDKFIGDAIVAVFGLKGEEHPALLAVEAAMEMIRSLPLVQTEGLHLPPMGYYIGIGVHQDSAIVGNIGSLEKSDYTAVGKVINIAEELEGLTKKYKRPILISQNVVDALKEQDLQMEEMGQEEGERLYSPVPPGETE